MVAAAGFESMAGRRICALDMNERWLSLERGD